MKRYINLLTGEETNTWSDAQLWHRAGMPVEVWKNGRKVFKFNAFI